ncbi:hypothetical protein FM076_01800 [Streptomyces albus subsp. chlorinus]|uniref:hypothetical protein n=1 Tax=Streptomyces albus TaxID=1888 RepID=UPI00156F2E4A|nr:hypothetical protein [Streptomyces albus]NSC20005.1 hypothetical protein [Streptomyces albus subsp. chlorinus]
MALLTPEDTGNSSSASPSPLPTWGDLVLLALVLTALIVLLLAGVELPQALAVVGAAGLITAEIRQRLSRP